MSEGEFKKRITEAYSKYYRGKASFGSKITDAIIDEAKKEIPKVLIYGTSEQLEDGYCHDDVWIMMDWIKKWFGI